MSSRPLYNILLVGVSGNGRSSTHDSILGRVDSNNLGIVAGSREIEGVKITAVDGPSLDKPMSEDEVKVLTGELIESMNQLEGGCDAVVLILRYGVRFTAKQKEAVDTLKNMLGPVLQEYVVCVMTYGDDFEKQTRRKSSGKTFLDWCQEQRGDMAELFKECEYRCILFENDPEDLEIKDKQLREFLEMVQRLKTKQKGRYMKEDFERAQRHRDKMVVEMKRSGLMDDVFKGTAEAQRGLNQAQDYLDRHQWYEAECELSRLEELVQGLSQKLHVEDKGTGVLDDLKNNVASLKKMIELRRGTAARMKADEEQMRKSEEVIEINNEERRRMLNPSQEGRGADTWGEVICFCLRFIYHWICAGVGYLWNWFS